MEGRSAEASDAASVADTIRLAFLADPVWGVALSRSDGTAIDTGSFWGWYVAGGLRYGTVSVVGDSHAVAVWIPPGGTELDDEQQAAVDAWIESELDESRAIAFHELARRFEAAHPPHPDHAYLSLLATHPDHRGQGLAQRLVAADLDRFDKSGTPAYLESSNPANNHRYERLGFRRIGGFETVIDGAPVSTMWRDPR